MKTGVQTRPIVTQFQRTSEDTRRDIYELLDFPQEYKPSDIARYSIICAKPGAVLGNHFHTYVETFIVAVECKLETVYVIDDGEENDRQVLEIMPYTWVIIPQRVAHKFSLQPNTSGLFGCIREIPIGMNPEDVTILYDLDRK